MADSENMIPMALTEVMRKHGFRQVDIVKKTGLSSSYISMVLNGQRTPEIYKLKEICSALEMSLSAFFLKVAELEKGNSKNPEFTKAFEILARIDRLSRDDDSEGDNGIGEAPQSHTPIEMEVAIY